MAAYTYSNAQENCFWLQLMGDNARIIRDRLLPDDSVFQKADSYIGKFDPMYERACKKMTQEELISLDREAYAAVMDFRSYVLSLLRDQLTKSFFILLKPIYLNNMVSMADEYLYQLGQYIQGNQPDFNPVVQDIFWLPVFYADAHLIADGVGIFDEKNQKIAAGFSNNFVKYFTFAVELQGIFRIGVTNFPIANQYRLQVLNELERFAQFIVELISLVRQSMLPGTLTLLDLDSMYRKLCYYTTQLSVLASTPKPACDPGAKRQSAV